MPTRRHPAVPATLLALAIACTGFDAGAAERYSGRVVAASDAGRRVTLETVGPWHGPGTGVRTIDVMVDPGTRISQVHRREGFPPGGWPGAYVSQPTAPAEIDVGDFVTVAVVEARGAARALSVEILGEGPPSATCAPDELLVGFGRPPSREAAAALYGRWHATVIETLRGLPVQRLRIAPEQRADAARALALHPDVRFVERNCTRSPAPARAAGIAGGR